MMIRRFTFLLGILAMLFTSCQQEEEGVELLGQDDAETVSFSFSVDSQIENGISYEPMGATTREGELATKLAFTNSYNYIIVKDVEGKLIVEVLGKARFDNNSASYNWVEIKSNTSYGGLDVELQPGDYEILFFTGDNSVTWNADIEKGDVLYDPDDQNAYPVNAFVLKRSDFWTHAGEYSLPEEIFYGRQDFTVTKTTDLHSSPNAHHVPIKLERRVAKFRTALKNDATPGELTFAKIAPLALLINVTMRKTDNSNFAYGLDVWGNLWYDPVNDLKELHIITMTEDAPFVASDTQQYYMSRYGCTAYSPYVLTSPGVSIPVTTGYVDCSIKQGVPRCTYYDEHNFVLNHNSIKGYTLRLTDDTENIGDAYPAHLLEVVTNPDNSLLDPTTLFDSNYEFNYE